MGTASDMTIGGAARRTRCSAATIRYYEDIGLLPPPARRNGGHRLYFDSDLRRIAFIRRCREAGFPIAQIRQLLNLAGSAEADCKVVRDLVRRRLDKVRHRLEELKALEKSIERMAEDCSAQCAGGPANECVIFTDLVSARKTCCGVGGR